MITLEAIDFKRTKLGYLYKQMNEIEMVLISVKVIGDMDRMETIEKDKAKVWNYIQTLEEEIRNDWDLLNNPV